jgi:hypothetical protein
MISVDYEIARKEAADQLGIRASVLDDLRSQKHRELKLDGAKTDDGQGRTLALPEVMARNPRQMGIATLLRMKMWFWRGKGRTVPKNAHSAARMMPRSRPIMERLRRGCTAGLVRMPGGPPLIMMI